MAKKKMRPSRPEDLALASQVARRVQIKNIQLVDAKLSFNDVGSVSDDVSISYGTATKVDADNLVVTVLMNTSVSDANNVINIVATFRATYTVDSIDGLTPECFDAFGSLNGLFNIWPFWREFVHNTTLRMGLPALTLPVQRPPANRPTASTISPKAKPRASRKK